MPRKIVELRVNEDGMVAEVSGDWDLGKGVVYISDFPVLYEELWIEKEYQKYRCHGCERYFAVEKDLKPRLCPYCGWKYIDLVG